MVLMPQSRLDGLGDAVELADLLVETAQTMRQSLRDVRLGGPAGVAAASEACIAASALAKLSKTANEVMRAHRERWHTTGQGPAVGAGTLEASKGTARRPNSARAAPTRSSRPRSAAPVVPSRPKTSRAAPAPASPVTVRGESAAMGGPLGSLASPIAPAMVAKVAETLVVGSPSPGRGISAKAVGAKSPARPGTAGTLQSPTRSPAKAPTRSPTKARSSAGELRDAPSNAPSNAPRRPKSLSRVLSRDNTPCTETLMVRRLGGSVANVKPVPVTHRRTVGAPAVKAAEEVSELLGAVGRKLGVGVPIVALVDVETDEELTFERYMNPSDGRVFPPGKAFIALTQEEVAARRKGVPTSPLKAKPKPKKKPKGRQAAQVEPLVERLSKPNKAAVSFQVTRAGAKDGSSSVPVTVPVTVDTIGEVLRRVSTALEVRAVAFTPCLALYHQPDPVTLKATEVATPLELVNGGSYLFRCAGDLAPGMVNNTAALKQKELLRQIAKPKAEKVDSFIVGVAHLADPYGQAVAMRLPGAKALQHLTFDDLCRRVRIAVGLSVETPVRGLFRADGTRLGSPRNWSGACVCSTRWSRRRRLATHSPRLRRTFPRRRRRSRRGGRSRSIPKKKKPSITRTRGARGWITRRRRRMSTRRMPTTRRISPCRPRRSRVR